ncbi:MAG: tol-pal system protein YbgF [Desulfuromonas sp.]|nr:MAG: tol-pal system protein YbgF [Desulfuromonas sp.]
MSAPTSAATTLPADDVSQEQLQDVQNELQRLQDSVVMLEARLLDQQKLIEKLQQQPAKAASTYDPATTEMSPASSQQSPTEIYLAAFGDYANGNYRKSISGFSRFLDLFPANDYAGHAHFWLAECYLALERYEQAINDFDMVITDYPDSGKAPDAMLKKAAALYQTGDEQSAIETIQLLKERYPESSAAKRASETFNQPEQ